MHSQKKPCTVMRIIHNLTHDFQIYCTQELILCARTRDTSTDKRTDVWSRIFSIWEIDFGQWAVAWAGPWEKGVWADSEQLFWVVFSLFRGQKIFSKFF